MCNLVKNYLIVLFAFVFPISIAAANIILGFMLICWLLEGNWREKTTIIKTNKLIWIIFAIPILIVVSTLFSGTITEGFFVNSGIKNEFQFVKRLFWLNTLFLILATSKFDYKKVLSAFLMGMFFSEIISYLIFFDLVDVEKLKSLKLLSRMAATNDPSPFMHHSFYSLFLAVSILLILDNLNKFSGIFKFFSLIFLISATVNLFINGGRTGQFALIFGVIVYVFLKYKKIKPLIISMIVLFFFILSAYKFSPIFKTRADMALSNIKKVYIKNDYKSSWGQRLAANISFIKIIMNNPKIFLFGCGAGEAKKVFFKEGEKYAPHHIKFIKNYSHLHNQFFQLWCDGSILAFLLIVFYFVLLYKYSPLPLTASIIVIIAFSFISDIMWYRPKTYLLILFVSAILLSIYRETNNIEKDIT